MIIKKTQQPTDVDLAKLRYPCLVSPKIDGVKLVRFNGVLTGRSFKPFRNKHLTELFDRPEFDGFEGEVIVGTNPYADDLCRATTSAVNSFEGEPTYTWLVFDYVTEETTMLPYKERIKKLQEVIYNHSYYEDKLIEVVGFVKVSCEYQLLASEQWYLDKGAEGLIIRDENSKYKQGRVTANSQECLRLKRYMDEEGIVLEVIEGNTNNNEAEINELGNTFRSSHKENLSPNGMVGSLIVKSVSTGQIDTISAGKMTHDERKFYFLNQNKIIGSIVKYKHFATGVLNKKRFPRFIGFRLAEDMS